MTVIGAGKWYRWAKYQFSLYTAILNRTIDEVNPNAGGVAAIVSRDNNDDLKDYQTNTFKYK